MVAHSKEIVNRFCVLCDWLHQAYQTRKCLFDDNPDWNNLKQPHYEHFFLRLSVILQEYWLHQLAKLHDPAVQGGHINLSIDYMIEYGQWDLTTQAALTRLHNEMTALITPIKDARNKLLSHNDLKTILESNQLGSFEAGKDDDYFRCLQEFASVVSEATVGESFVYDNLVKNDIEIFMACFNRGRIS